MSPTRSRKPQARFNPFLAGLLVVLAIIGAVVTLDLTGVTDTGLSRLFEKRRLEAGPNMVSVLLPVRMLEPGHEIGRADLWDAQAKRMRGIPMTPEAAAENHYATGLNQVNGRVLARPKSSNEPFIPEDFLPKGTPPGLVGLVPQGMRLALVSAAKVKGLEALRFRDQFDLYVNDAVSEKMLAAARKVLDQREHVSDEDRLRLAQAEKALRQRLLAQSGHVLRQADPLDKSKDKEVALALHPDDVESVLAAMDDGSTIYCIARSQEDANAAQRVAMVEPDPLAELDWLLDDRQDVEVFNGNERNVISVPRVRKKN
jgi:hypothetical protein